jgi:hypothetical protein
MPIFVRRALDSARSGHYFSRSLRSLRVAAAWPDENARKPLLAAGYGALWRGER